jgi:hypothetical protein
VFREKGERIFPFFDSFFVATIWMGEVSNTHGIFPKEISWNVAVRKKIKDMGKQHLN